MYKRNLMFVVHVTSCFGTCTAITRHERDHQRNQSTLVRCVPLVFYGLKNVQMKFFGNPNNAFVAQGITAVTVGGLHIFSYDNYIRQWAAPVYKFFGKEVGSVAVVRSHAV